MRKINIFFILLSFFIFNNVQAQNIEDSNVFSNISDVVITEVTVDQHQPTTNSTISGTISFYNETERFIPEFNYTIGLVDENGRDFNQIGKTNFGPENIREKTVKKVNYSYNIPKAVLEGENFLFIRTFASNGRPGGMFKLPINISKKNNLSLIDIKDAYVSVDGKDFSIQEGPTVNGSQSLKLIIEFNTSKIQKESFIPHVVINDMQVTSEKILDEKLPEFVISSNSNKIEYYVKIKDFKPGVYSASISVSDKEGNLRSQIIDFRFIKQGSISYIKEILSSKDSLEKGDQFNLFVDTVGTPYDIQRDIQESLKNPNIDIRVYNELDELIAAHASSLEIGSVLNVSLTSSEKAKAIRIEAELKEGDLVVDSYNLKHTENFNQIMNESKNENKNIISIVASIIALIIILTLARVYFVNKNKKNNIAMIILLIALSFTAFIFPNNSEAATLLAKRGGGPIVTVSAPISAPGKVYKYKESIPYNIEISSEACNNKTVDLSLTVYKPTKTMVLKGEGTNYYKSWFPNNLQVLEENEEIRQKIEGNHDTAAFGNAVSGNFTETLSPGTYYIYIKAVRGYVRDNGEIGSEKDAYYYQEFTVSEEEYVCQDGSTNPPLCNNAVNASCGTSAKEYSTSQTSYGASPNFCSTGTPNPATPTFPAIEQVVQWTCSGQNGGQPKDCAAARCGVNQTLTNNVCEDNLTSPGDGGDEGTPPVGDGVCDIGYSCGQEGKICLTDSNLCEDLTYQNDQVNKVLLSLNPPIVNPNSKCTVSWTLQDPETYTGKYLCGLYNLFGNSVSDNDDTAIGFQVSPGEYKVMCQKTIDSTWIESNSKKCFLNPYIIEI
jgi:hypothetical protein